MTREEVKLAFREAIAEINDKDLEMYKNEKHEFSQQFLKKMDRLIRKNRNPLWHMVNTTPKKVLLALILCLIILSSLTAIPSVKAYTSDLLKQVFTTHIALERKEENKSEEMITYVITSLPEGYLKTSQVHGPGSVKTEYTDKNGNILFLEQYSSAGSMSLTYDNEAGTVKEILLEDVTAYLYQNQNYYSLSWSREGTILILSGIGGFTEEEFISIGLSVKPAE